MCSNVKIKEWWVNNRTTVPNHIDKTSPITFKREGVVAVFKSELIVTVYSMKRIHRDIFCDDAICIEFLSFEYCSRSMLRALLIILYCEQCLFCLKPRISRFKHCYYTKDATPSVSKVVLIYRRLWRSYTTTWLAQLSVNTYAVSHPTTLASQKAHLASIIRRKALFCFRKRFTIKSKPNVGYRSTKHHFKITSPSILKSQYHLHTFSALSIRQYYLQFKQHDPAYHLSITSQSVRIISQTHQHDRE